MNQKDSADPEMQQLNSMMDKIINIQHPERLQDKIRQTSEVNKGQVFSVGVNSPVNSISILDNKSNKMFFNDTSRKLATQPNEAEVQANAENVVKANRNIKGVKDKKFGIKLQLDAIYLHDEVMYYRIHIQNHSNID